jgi:DNA topoisomerase I
MGGAQLRMIDVGELDILRRRAGRGFAYFDSLGRHIKDPEILARIRKLAVPPAYVEVRIASDDRAHLQAIGRDAAGRWQYRYHVNWNDIREKRKVVRVADLLAALPRIRLCVRRDMASRQLDKAKAAACAVAMIDESHIRVGGESYARSDGGCGAATLLKRHVSIGRDTIRLQFPGKGGKIVRRLIVERALARALRQIAKLPGRRLLQFLDEPGPPRPLTASDVNDYLQRVSNASVSAKDFRTAAASALAAEKLAAIAEPPLSESERKRQISAVMRLIAAELVNTPAIVRKSYVHTMVEKSFRNGALRSALKRARPAPYRPRAESLLGELARSI